MTGMFFMFLLLFACIQISQPAPLQFTFIVGAITLLVYTAIILFIVGLTGWRIYQLAFLYSLATVVGVFFKVLHWEGADLILMSSGILYLLTAVLLIFGGVRSWNSSRIPAVFTILIGLIVLSDGIGAFYPYLTKTESGLFHYVLLAVSILMLYKSLLPNKYVGFIVYLLFLENSIFVLTETVGRFEVK